MTGFPQNEPYGRAPRRCPLYCFCRAVLLPVLLCLCIGCRMMNGTEFADPPTLSASAKIYSEPVLLRGRSPEYPLPMASITESYAWLDRLTDLLGNPVAYERVQSLRQPLSGCEPTADIRDEQGLRGLLNRLRGHTPSRGHIIDCYRITDRYGNKRLIYLDPYAGRTASEAPEGLRLRPPRAR